MESNVYLEDYLTRIRASLWTRICAGLLDLVYLLCMNLPIFILIAWHPAGQAPWNGTVRTFHNFVEKHKEVPASRMIIFSIWMIIVCYIYFVIIPSQSDYQTFFGNVNSIRAINLTAGVDVNNRPTQKQLFKANFVPIFALLFLNLLFFSVATISGNNSGWWKELVVQKGVLNSHSITSSGYRWTGGFRILYVGLFFIQMHYLFTAAGSKNSMNWFTRSTGIFWIDLEKAKLVMETQKKPDINLEVDFPGLSQGFNYYDVDAERGEFMQEIDTFKKSS
nr:RDD family protein [Mycoplasma haemocanis]